MRAIAAEIEPTRIAAAPAVWTLPDRGMVGMAVVHHRRVGDLHDLRRGLSLLLGKSLTGPTPRDVLEVPIFYTICLLSSSVTIHLAGRRLERDESRRVPACCGCSRSRLAASSCSAPAQEWHRLIYEHGLTISTNLFGTTYYSLVGLHAFHVTVGLVHARDRRSWLGVAGRVRAHSPARIDVLSLYWHFVDVVWVVVFTVVYVIGR